MHYLVRFRILLDFLDRSLVHFFADLDLSKRLTLNQRERQRPLFQKWLLMQNDDLLNSPYCSISKIAGKGAQGVNMSEYVR
jgi:hypothetical protein